VLAIGASAAPSAATVTLGQTGTAGGFNCGSPHEQLQTTVTSGPSYAAPAAGTIVSWSTLAGGAGLGGPVKLKVYRPVAGAASAFTVVAQDVERPLALNILNSFNLAPGIAVQRGDLIGLGSPSGVYACTHAGGGDRRQAFTDVANGGTVTTVPFTGTRVNVSAVLDPTNAITLGAVKKNKKKGNATLTVTVPNPGALSLSGKGVKAATVSAAAAGEVPVVIRAKGKKKSILNDDGKVKLSPTVAFTPTGGSETQQATKVKLKKN
jgi:hypothetical protein